MHGWLQDYSDLDDDIWNRLQTYAWPILRPSQSAIIAETVLILSWTMLFESFANVHITYSRTIEIYDCSWDGAFTVMDDAIWNRLQMCALPLPGPPKSRIRDKILLTLSRTMLLFEIIYKRTYDPTPGPSQFMIIAEMVLKLSWTMLFETFSKSTHDPLPEPSKSLMVVETVLKLSWTMLFEIGCKSTHGPLQDHQTISV